ncbi:MAG: hypothetical protein F6K41_26425 [Symploca sp. SIO3E6]|nr:hypothetical protein [Caldora sp. SIO3E6]
MTGKGFSIWCCPNRLDGCYIISFYLATFFLPFCLLPPASCLQSTSLLSHLE